MVTDPIVWMPIFTGSGYNRGLRIQLTGAFYTHAGEYPVSLEKVRALVAYCNRDLRGIREDTFRFRNDTLALEGIYLPSGNGKWLAFSEESGGIDGEHIIMFDGHNIDTDADVFSLLYLFQAWTRFTDVHSSDK